MVTMCTKHTLSRNMEATCKVNHKTVASPSYYVPIILGPEIWNQLSNEVLK